VENKEEEKTVVSDLTQHLCDARWVEKEAEVRVE
jgi:hypothetical protein